jgi:PAS domain S-box-containing protein
VIYLGFAKYLVCVVLTQIRETHFRGSRKCSVGAWDVSNALEMSNAMAWTDEGAGNDGRSKTSIARQALLLSALSLALGLSVSAWMYSRGAHAISGITGSGGRGLTLDRWAEHALLLQQFDHSIMTIMVPTATGGALCVSLMLGGLGLSRRFWLKGLKAKEEEWRKSISGLQIQLAASRSSEDMLKLKQAEDSGKEHEGQIRRLELRNAQLQTELDQLKRAEKTLSQRRQELESSKTVLELHVQERTGELQKLQRRYELILNSAGEGICGLDLDGKATFVNPAVSRITGFAIVDLIGKTEKEIFGQNGTNGEVKNAGERIFHRKDGACVPLEYVRTPIHENEREVGAVLVFKDIAERKRVEEAIAQKAAELARSNAELEQFAFVASHDLQEPLRKIQAFGDRLKGKIGGAAAPEAQEYLERMQNASARMRTLINDLLTFSRVIRRTEPFVSVDLGAVTKGVLGDLEVRIEKSGAKIEVGDLPTMEADPMQMHQLLLNLLSNALKFQPQGAQPVVKIRSRTFSALSGEQLCEITVQDNGIGFEEKYLEKMFAVFQRLHGRSEYEGTGVGLAVCRRITDRHHGTITARSQLGKGATFIITLPMHQTKTEAAK